MKKVLGFLILGVVAFSALGYALLHGHTFQVLDAQGIVAQQERNLIYFALALSLLVVVPVFALILGITWRYRETNTKAVYKPEFDHHRGIETIWWAIPMTLIVILSIVTWQSSHALDPFKPLKSDKPTLTIQVVALDWKWLFIYPDQQVAAVNYARIPVDTPVQFVITADAPMNSFWVPQLGGQIYAMAGMTTQLHLMADHEGSYRGTTANISGEGFSRMTFTVEATSNESFNDWATHVSKTASPLTFEVYNKLAKPSSNAPITYYSNPAPDLYATILMKYMSPTNGGEGIMQGMSH